jgi:hypothetical protein
MDIIKIILKIQGGINIKTKFGGKTEQNKYQGKKSRFTPVQKEILKFTQKKIYNAKRFSTFANKLVLKYLSLVNTCDYYVFYYYFLKKRL